MAGWGKGGDYYGKGEYYGGWNGGGWGYGNSKGKKGGKGWQEKEKAADGRDPCFKHRSWSGCPHGNKCVYAHLKDDGEAENPLPEGTLVKNGKAVFEGEGGTGGGDDENVLTNVAQDGAEKKKAEKQDPAKKLNGKTVDFDAKKDTVGSVKYTVSETKRRARKLSRKFVARKESGGLLWRADAIGASNSEELGRLLRYLHEEATKGGVMIGKEKVRELVGKMIQQFKDNGYVPWGGEEWGEGEFEVNELNNAEAAKKAGNFEDVLTGVTDFLKQPNEILETKLQEKIDAIASAMVIAPGVVPEPLWGVSPPRKKGKAKSPEKKKKSTGRSASSARSSSTGSTATTGGTSIFAPG